MRTTAGIVLLVPLLVTLPFGATAFAIAAMLAGAVVLLDLSGLLAATAARPVVVAALVPLIAIPTAALGGNGWTAAPAAYAAAFLLTILAVLAFGRRRRVTAIAGGTMLAALLPGLGIGGLVLLRALPAGMAWVVAVLALSAAADLGGPLARLAAGLLARRRGLHARTVAAPADDAPLALLAGAVAVGLIALLTVLLGPGELGAAAVVGTAVAAFTATHVSAAALRRVAGDAGIDPDFTSAGLGEGIATAAAATVLLAAPAAYVLASSLGG